MTTVQKTLYDTLGVMPEATDKEIQKAFRKLSKTLHPDLNDASDAAERFAEVKEAYEILSDKDLRIKYDKQLKSGEANAKPETTFDDIFGAFFDNKRGTSVPVQGEHIEMTLHVTAEEILRAAPKELKLKKRKTCGDCSGTGQRERKGTCNACKGEGGKKRMTKTPFGAISSMDRCEECNGTGKKPSITCTTCEGRGTIPEYENFEFQLDPTIRFGKTMVFKHKGHAGTDGGETGDLRVLLKQSESDSLKVTYEVDLNEIKRVPLKKVLDGSNYLLVFPDGDSEEIDLSKAMDKGSMLVFQERGLMDDKGDRGFYNLEIIVEYPQLSRLQRNQILETLGDD